MSHVVLARKYRPRSFAQMVGQAHVVQALGNALRSGRLHHAYLFTGTRGIGKTTVSRILAKSLNCTEIDADRYIDYIELDAASNGGKDEIKDLIERAAYKPGVARYKVFMIDECHQLSKDAFNALLKTLEEPPDYLKFVLATTDPEKVLPTVLSRCLQFNLRPMAPETVAEHLQHVLAAEGVAAEPGALRLLSRAARGSMRDALSLTDQAIAFGAGALAEEGVRTMLGTVDRSHAASLVRALAQRDGTAVLATIDTLRGMGLSAAGTLEEMAGLLQQMAVEQVVPGALDDTDPDQAAARHLAGQLPPDETQLLYGIVVHGRAELSLLNDEYAALTMVLLRLLAFPAAGGAASTASLPRAAPLVAAPREARSAVPAVAMSALPKPAALAPAAQVVAQVAPIAPITPARPPAPAAPAAAARSAPARQPTEVATPVAARPAPAARSFDEPPPWADEPMPDEFGAADSAAMPDIDDREPVAAWSDEPAQQAGLRLAGPAPAPPPPLQRTPLGDRWSDLVRPLAAAGSLVAMVRELAWQAEPLATGPAEGGGLGWQLRVERESLRNPGLAVRLAAALTEAQGQPVVIEVVAGAAGDSLVRRDSHARETAQRAAEQLIHDDPEVRALMAQFRTARIVAGSIKPLAADGGGLQTTPKAPPP